MKVKRLLALTFMVFCATSVWAYSFSAVSPSGHTLYYNIVAGHAEVVRPGTGSSYNNYVTGDVVIPDSVTHNGISYAVTALTTVSIYGPFYGCSGLTSVTIPSSVTLIGSSAFYGCSGLTSVTIPSSVTSIGDYAFSYCSGLTTTVYTGTIAQWCSISFSGYLSTPLYYSNSLTIDGVEITNLVIPEEVTSIGNYAFYRCSGLTSVTIPSSVTSIGNSTFFGCSGLTSVNIPSSVTSIGSYAFDGCSGLTSVTIPSSVTSIGSYAFNNVRHIEYYGSATGSPWGAISINGVTDGVFVFSDATKHYLLAYIGAGGDVTIPSTVDTIGNKAFYGCRGLTSVTIPSSVTLIDSSAFSGCSGLTSVTIPSSVTSIGSSAFSVCSGLTSVTIPSSVTSIGSSVFYGCSGLTSVTIPSSVTSIGRSAFSGCSGLISVTIPSSVTSIGDYAFHNCSGLTYVTIPSSVTSIGSWAFSDCSGLTSVTIPSSVTSIGGYAFYNCSGLTSVTILASVTSIGYRAFSGCSGLTSVTIPSSVTSINGYAFEGCSGLTSVTIPSSVTTIGYYAFSGCSGLTVMRMNPATPPSLGNLSSINDSIIDLVVPHNSYWTYANANNNYTRHHIYSDTVFFSVNVNDTARGIVAGYNSIYTYPELPPDTITLTATPNYGYHFGHWENGDTCSVRRLANITYDTSITAYFDKNQYSVRAQCDTSIHGYIYAPAQGSYLDEVSLSARAHHGYHFTHWQDGDTNNPRTFILTQDTDFVAYYDKNVYTLTFQSNNSDIGIVNTTSVSSEYLDTTMQIYATAIPHYHFVRWDDNNTENPRRFVFDDNHTYTAYFAIDEHTVNVQVDNLAHGTVSGAGTREYGQPATVSATPYSGYQFAHWSDGSTYNPYTFAVLEDKSLTAIFFADGEPWQDTVVVFDTAYVTLHDTTYINVPVHDTTYINVPVHDTTYITLTDTLTVTQYDTITNTVFDTVDNYIYDTVTVTQYDTITNTVFDTIDNYIYDTVTVTDTLWLTQFDTVWMHDTVIIHDTIYITNEGIGDVEAMAAKVYASKGQIVVDGANGNRVTLYDVNGRVLATKRDEYALLRFDAPASGTYIIKIGNYPARKVVVIR